MELIASVSWRRLDAPGRDACSLARTSAGWRLQGTCRFRGDEGVISLRYRVDCDHAWRTRAGRIAGRVGDSSVRVAIGRRGRRWTLNGAPAPAVDGLLDLDLSFTPATNLTQMKRLDMPVGARAGLPVAWFALDGVGLSRLPQCYARTGPLTYAYEAPTVGYAGRLEMREDGFVRRYPGLWEAVPPA